MNELKRFIEKIANLSHEEIGKSEENVKQKIVVPLLECLGHNRNELDFEYGSGRKRIDIFIKNLPKNCKVVIDVKNYDKDLDNHLEQIGLYAFQEGALLALLINGEEIRIYDPSFRGLRFRDSLIYSLKREKLADDKNIEILKKMLLRINLENEKVKDHIMEREQEIVNTYSKIEKVKEDFKKRRKKLQDQKDNLQSQIIEIGEEINNLSLKERKEISQLLRTIGIPYLRSSTREIIPSEIRDMRTRNIFVKSVNKVQIILNNLHTPRKYALIPISRENRRFFPGYKVPFIMETDFGEIRTKVTSAPKNTKYGDSDAGKYIQGGLKPWYDRHKDLKIGDKLIIEVIESKKLYKLYVEKR